ncbi:unnamed protein product, partial [Meganyctiphanes norvegica]
NNYDYNEETCICDYKPKTSPNTTCTNGLFNLTSPRVVFYVCSLIPCIFIPIGYFMIFHQIHLSGQQVKRTGTSLTQTTIAMRRSQTTKVILRLLFVSIICISPICIFNIVQIVTCFNNPLRGLSVFLYCVYWIQYCANSFIYALSNKNYWFAYKQFLAYICCSDIPVPASMVSPLRGNQNIHNRSNHQLSIQPQPRVKTISEHIHGPSLDSAEIPNPDTASLASVITSDSIITYDRNTFAEGTPSWPHGPAIII